VRVTFNELAERELNDAASTIVLDIIRRRLCQRRVTISAGSPN